MREGISPIVAVMLYQQELGERGGFVLSLAAMLTQPHDFWASFSFSLYTVPVPQWTRLQHARRRAANSVQAITDRLTIIANIGSILVRRRRTRPWTARQTSIIVSQRRGYAFTCCRCSRMLMAEHPSQACRIPSLSFIRSACYTVSRQTQESRRC